ncbi:hypothetical protein ACLOJK_014143 [Asimina triloba]
MAAHQCTRRRSSAWAPVIVPRPCQQASVAVDITNMSKTNRRRQQAVQAGGRCAVVAVGVFAARQWQRLGEAGRQGGSRCSSGDVIDGEASSARAAAGSPDSGAGRRR